MRRVLVSEELVQDLRIGFRGLVRARVMTFTIVATVGLGIGATAVTVAAIDAVLVRPLPYADPGRLVRIYTDYPPNKFPFSVADYLALTRQQTRFERIAGYATGSMAFSDGVTAERVKGKTVSWTYFGLLGVTPVAGRDFIESDSRPNGPRVVIVSHAFWRQRLGARPDIVGRPIRLDGAEYTLVGVLPRKVGPLEHDREYFVAAQWADPPRKGPFFITVLGRLRAGDDASGAADELRAINRRIFPIWRTSYQDSNATWSMEDLKAFVIGDVRTLAEIAFGAVALVWLIACANASNLLIARVTSRRRELAMRAALGASRGRLVRYLLAESVLLAVGAAAVGTSIAAIAIPVLRNAGAQYFSRTQEIAFNGPVTWLLIAGTAVSALLFGMIPALDSGWAPDEALRSSGTTHTEGTPARRVRRALVAAQFAIATPLLVIAGLLLASLVALGRVDLGFDTRGLLSGFVDLPHSRYGDAGSVRSFWDRLQQRISSQPGVSAISFADARPPNEVDVINNFDLEEYPTRPGQLQPVTPWVSITPEYFHVLGLKLLQGRLLDSHDAAVEDIESVVVDRAWAARFFPNENAVGKRLRGGGCTACSWTTVVGIVSDVKYAGLDKPDEGTVYWVMPPDERSRFIVVRAAGSPASVFPAIRQAVREIDPTLPFSDAATMDELIDASIQKSRSLWLLVASFGAVAVVLSAIGIYGVMAYFVQQHAKDITIRIALGGNRSHVLRLVVGQGMQLVSAGVVAGLLIAFVATRSASSLLFGVSASDPPTFAAVAIFMLALALAASLVPARRALRIEPAAVLREQ